MHLPLAGVYVVKSWVAGRSDVGDLNDDDGDTEAQAAVAAY